MQHISPAAPNRQSRSGALYIIGLLFFIFGFVTWLNGTLIPFLKLACQLQNDIQAFFVTFAFYMAFFFLALPSSFILKKIGYKNGMALGLLIMAAGSILFIPAAKTRLFGLFLTGLFVQGTGLALLQTASNPYVSILGPIESAAKRISIMGIANKVAGVLSPVILGALVLSKATHLETALASAQTTEAKEALLSELASRIITPYTIMSIVLVVLSFFIKASNLPHIEAEETEVSRTKSTGNIFRYRHLLLGVACIFVYVGVEVLAADAIGTYGQTIGITLDKTKYFTTFTLLAMLIGYIAGIFTIPKIISQQTGLTISAALGIIFSIIIYFSKGYTAITFIALLGLANALMWPSIFPLAIADLGRLTNTGAALLIMGIAGGAVMPLLYGYLKEQPGLNNSIAFILCTLPCYLYILYYSIDGYKAGKKQKAKRIHSVTYAPAQSK